MTQTLTVGGLTFVNTTPHKVRVVAADGSQILEIPPCGWSARLAVRHHGHDRIVAGDLAIRTARVDRSDLDGAIPSAVAAADVVISSEIAAPALAKILGKRIYFPDTSPGQVIRDSSGQVDRVLQLAYVDP